MPSSLATTKSMVFAKWTSCLLLCARRQSTTTPVSHSPESAFPRLSNVEEQPRRIDPRGAASTSSMTGGVPLLEIDPKTLEESQAARLLKENLGLAKQLPKRMKHARIHNLAERARFFSHPDYVSQKDLLERAVAAKDLADSIQSYQKAKTHLRVKQRTGYRTMKYIAVPNAEGTAYRDPTLNFGGGKVAGQLYPRLDPRLEAFYSAEFDKKYCFKEEDVTETIARGHGPGGQAVNMRAQTCTLLHRPSSIIVKVSKYPSLWQNRKIARGLLHRKVEAFLLGDDSRDARLTREAWRQRQFALTTQKLASELAVEKEQRRWWKLLAFHAGSKDAAACIANPLKEVDSTQSRRRRELELAVIKEAETESSLSAEVISPLCYAQRLADLLRSLAKSSLTDSSLSESTQQSGADPANFSVADTNAASLPTSPSLELIESLLGSFGDTSGKPMGRQPASAPLVSLDCLKAELSSHWWTLLELSWKELPVAQRLIDDTIASLSGDSQALLARRIARLRETRGLGWHRTTPFRQVGDEGQSLPRASEEPQKEFGQGEKQQQPCPRLSLLPLWFSFLFPCPIVSVSCRGTLESESETDSQRRGFIDAVVSHEQEQGAVVERRPLQLPCQLISFCVPLKMASRVCREVEAVSSSESQTEPETSVTDEYSKNRFETAHPVQVETVTATEVESCISEDWNSNGDGDLASNATVLGAHNESAEHAAGSSDLAVGSGEPSPELEVERVDGQGEGLFECAVDEAHPDEIHCMTTEADVDEAVELDAEDDLDEADADEHVGADAAEKSVVVKSQEKLLQTEALLQELGKNAMEDELKKCCSSEVVRHSVESLVPLFLELFGLRLTRKDKVVAERSEGFTASTRATETDRRPQSMPAAGATSGQPVTKKKKKIVVVRGGKPKPKSGEPVSTSNKLKANDPSPPSPEGEDLSDDEQKQLADEVDETSKDGLRIAVPSKAETAGDDFPTAIKVEREGLRWVELRHRLLHSVPSGATRSGTTSSSSTLYGAHGVKKEELAPNPLAVASFAHVLCCLESLKLVDELHAIILFLRDAMSTAPSTTTHSSSSPRPSPGNPPSSGGLPPFPASVARCILKAFALLRKA